MTTSPDGTTILLGSLSTITDNAGNLWSLTAGGVVNINGAAAGFTVNVISIVWSAGLIYQENNNFNWWFWDSTTPWVQTVAPITSLPQSGNGGFYGGGAGGHQTTGFSGDGGPGIIVITNIPISTGLIWVDAQIYNMFSD